MQLKSVYLMAIATLLVSVACSPRSATAPVETEPTAGACVGNLDIPAQFEPAQDSALLASALGKADSGGLCTAAVFQARQSVAVYRIWEKSRPYSVYGQWWTLDAPKGSLEQYRADYAICTEWGARDTTVVCTLKVGTKVVLGTGQSMACQDATYPVSPRNQLFIPNDTRKEQLYVENCVGFPYP